MAYPTNKTFFRFLEVTLAALVLQHKAYHEYQSNQSKGQEESVCLQNDSVSKLHNQIINVFIKTS